MDDVGAPDLADEQRPIDALRDDRPKIFDPEQRIERAWGNGIDGDKPCVDLRVAAPRIEQAVRLNRLSAQNAK
jgi:hypothetical protein